MNKQQARVTIDKHYLKKALSSKEGIPNAIKRLVDNSIEAYEKAYMLNEKCKIQIELYENLIVVTDNSGGINEGISTEELFKIGGKKNNKFLGVGLKKSLFRLGNAISIESNRKNCSRKFHLDFNSESDDLICQSEGIEYKDYIDSGTKIYINDLEMDVKSKILSNELEDEISEYFSRIYRKK